MKKTLLLMGAALTIATPAVAAEVPQEAAPPAQFNCDYQPSCEVAPGIYGKMYSPMQSKFKVSVGGYVKLDYAYNSENLGPSGVISPLTGAMPARALSATAQSANQSQSILSLRQSRLWLKVDGPNLLGAKTGALVEGDFYGDNSAATESPMFRLRLAYGTLDWANTQLLFGQAYDMFAPMLANTQDFRSGAPYGAPNSPRIPQVRLSQKVNITPDQQLKLVAAVQDPDQYGNNQAAATGGYGPNLNYNGQITYTNKTLGTAPGYFGMSMNPLTLTAFGQYGSEKAASNDNHHIDTWGYGLYTFVPILRSRNGMDRTMTMSFEGQIYKAANMTYNGTTWTTVTGTTPSGAYPQGGISNELNVNGSQTPAQDWAATGQIIFYPTQNLGITGGWGSRYAFNIDNYRSNFVNYERQNQEIYGNVAYDFNAALRLAAEYQNMETVYGNANRVNGGIARGVDNTLRLAAYYFF